MKLLLIANLFILVVNLNCFSQEVGGRCYFIISRYPDDGFPNTTMVSQDDFLFEKSKNLAEKKDELSENKNYIIHSEVSYIYNEEYDPKKIELDEKDQLKPGVNRHVTLIFYLWIARDHSEAANNGIQDGVYVHKGIENLITIKSFRWNQRIVAKPTESLGRNDQKIFDQGYRMAVEKLLSTCRCENGQLICAQA